MNRPSPNQNSSTWIPSLFWRQVAILVALACLMGAVPESTVGQLTREAWKRGYHGFNMLIQGNELKICDKREWLDAPAYDRLLILLGDIQDLPVDLEDSARQGATIFVGTDRMDHGSVLKPFGFRVQDGFFHSDGDNYVHAACPKIEPTYDRRRQKHPIFQNVRYVVANQPGTIVPYSNVRSLARLKTIATFGGNFGIVQNNLPFALATPSDSRFRAAFFSDSTFLNNQMLPKGNNALCAKNILDWLSEGRPKSVLLIINNQVQPVVDPASMVLLPPPPTEQEVLNTLKDLPPQAWLEFGNTVVQAAEDNNLANEFLQKVSEEITYKQAFRAVLLALFFGMVIFGLSTYAWQKKLMRKTSSVVAEQRAHLFSSQQRSRLAAERQVAASLILGAFCLDLTNRRLEHWGMFPQGLNIGDDNQAKSILIEMADYHQALRNHPPTYWTPHRLRSLESDSLKWRSILIARGFLDQEEASTNMPGQMESG